MKYHHIRHATGILHYGGLEILIDPLLVAKEEWPPIPDSWNDLKNPRVELPVEPETLNQMEYCLVTHLHPDHFANYGKKDVFLICQAEDEGGFKQEGFTNVNPIVDDLEVENIHITRVKGQHGTGVIAEKMGTSSGYIFSAPDEPTLYITGDTIFYEEVEKTLVEYKPEVIIAFGGAAQFAMGDPITLSPEDILAIHQVVPQAKIICTHMEAINHCRTTREGLKKFLSENVCESDSFVIPDDGEKISI